MPKKGQPLSAAARAKLSAARKGQAFTTGYHFTPAQRANMRAAKLRLFARSPEHLERLRAMALKNGARRALPPEEKRRRAKLRNGTKHMLRRLMTLSRRRKDRRTEELLGYSKKQLLTWLESQLPPGARWDSGDWPIDTSPKLRYVA